MEKLSKYASSNEGGEVEKINKNLDIFKLFKKYMDKIIE